MFLEPELLLKPPNLLEIGTDPAEHFAAPTENVLDIRMVSWIGIHGRLWVAHREIVSENGEMSMKIGNQTEKAESGKPMRMFIALDPPVAWKDELAAVQKQLKAEMRGGFIRWMDPMQTYDCAAPGADFSGGGGRDRDDSQANLHEIPGVENSLHGNRMLSLGETATRYLGWNETRG
ncbi:MAG TPA: hypothetical protein VGR78_17935 [Verrucomicrobiae bacterium]|nr:hypothetical protein [Verrucomicrobiae bacterium]